MTNTPSTPRLLFTLISAALLFNLAGCATHPTSADDPLEPLNRKIFSFNTKIDKIVLRPVARTYTKLPPFVQARFTNFFNNIDEIPSTVNDALQLDVYHTLSDGSRFLVNTTLGIGGFWDPASHMQLPPHYNDLGLTLARWGMTRSPYFVIPFFGSSTLRDAIASPINQLATPYPYVNWWISYPVWALQKVTQRAALLPADSLVDEAFDPYVFVRDAYLQNRNSRISQLPGQTPLPTTASNVSNSNSSGDTVDSFVDDNTTHATTSNASTGASGTANRSNNNTTVNPPNKVNAKNNVLPNQKLSQASVNTAQPQAAAKTIMQKQTYNDGKIPPPLAQFNNE